LLTGASSQAEPDEAPPRIEALEVQVKSLQEDALLLVGQIESSSENNADIFKMALK
jgi:hypothetical protein